MKNVQSSILLCFCLSVLFFSDKKELNPTTAPLDYMYAQRAFPYHTVDAKAYRAALRQAQNLISDSAESMLTWQSDGPTNIGGRITCLATKPNDFTHVYAGAASGGVWESRNSGVDWTPIADDLPTLSIGDIAVTSDRVVVGTGESNGGGGSLAYDGLGVFQKIGNGAWEHLGLEQVGSIGKVLVHPLFPEQIYVAAMGDLFEKNSDRGVYRTLDGGTTWEKILFVNDSTGAIDMAFAPNNPNHIYAATWQRTRTAAGRDYGGPGCGIYRSTDSGDTWMELENGLPNTNNGRIGLAVTPADPDIIFALYESKSGNSKGVFRSYDKGQSWVNPGSGQDISYPGYGWWFGKLVIDPSDAQRVYALGLVPHKSTNGAFDFSDIAANIHVDQHALLVDPNDSDNIYFGNDGGFYHSTDGAATAVHRPMPITQLYTGSLSYMDEQVRFGGTQDNGTWRRLNDQEGAYEFINGGDGFYVSINQDSAQYIMVESQYGAMLYSDDGGDSYWYVGSQITGFPNWNMPIVRNPKEQTTVYCGAQALHRSVDNGLTWETVSGDLTKAASSQFFGYGSITSISVSAQNASTIWVATDDGNVQVSTNGGSNFVNVSTGLPLRWISRVVADPFDSETAYVTLSGYRYNDYLPHVFKTTDLGQSWMDISGNLPEAPANDLIIDPLYPNRLYVATDMGVCQTDNGGLDWYPVASGMPIVPVNDLDFNPNSRQLLAATYGRGFYSVVVDLPVFTQHIAEKKEVIKVYPNPVSDVLFFEKEKGMEGEKQDFRVELYDMYGKLLKLDTLNSTMLLCAIPVEDLPKGYCSYSIYDKQVGDLVQSGIFLKY